MGTSARRAGKNPEQRLRAARRWLQREGISDDDANVAVLAPYFFRPDPAAMAYVRAAGQLIASGEPVTRAAVQERVARVGQCGPEWIERATAAGVDLDAEGPVLAAMLAAYRAVHAQGPLWSEVGAARGWDQERTELVLSALAAAGWVTFTAMPRSLTPGAPAPDGGQPTARAGGHADTHR